MKSRMSDNEVRLAVAHKASSRPSLAPRSTSSVELRATQRQERRGFVVPSNEIIARFLGVTLGGALLGSTYAPLPMAGALFGALFGAGVVAFRIRHAAL